jgi:hypothetical protein
MKSQADLDAAPEERSTARLAKSYHVSRGTIQRL